MKLSAVSTNLTFSCLLQSKVFRISKFYLGVSKKVVSQINLTIEKINYKTINKFLKSINEKVGAFLGA